ncbi:MAG: MFS transporter [Candidatus Eisenbacteria bacterium]|nr:MFS transporter [Candidatus Eisenbacteria bacterium]
MFRPLHALQQLRSSSGRKLLWVALLYFAQGLPFGIFQEALPVYFRVHGVSLKQIGFFSLLGLPWSAKVFWSPLVDRFGRMQVWILVPLLAMAALLLAIPSLDPAHPSLWLWTALLAFTMASATQDIAIDGYTIGFVDRRQMGTANGIRVSAYRVALILGGGGLVALAGTLSWRTLFAVTALVFVALAASVAFTPRIPRDPAERRDPIRPLLRWLRRPAAPAALAFILVYKLGDSAMGPMVRPFWVDRGMSLFEIGMITTTFGVFASIVGALAGGWLTSRIGILRGLWVLGLFQAISNLVYAGVALAGGGRAGIYTASLFESFSSGLGTAAFLAFLMSICERDHAATQYALLSALFGFTRSIAGGLSGWGTERMGYAPYFAFTFLLALPAYALLPWVSRYLRAARAETEGEAGG